MIFHLPTRISLSTGVTLRGAKLTFFKLGSRSSDASAWNRVGGALGRVNSLIKKAIDCVRWMRGSGICTPVSSTIRRMIYRNFSKLLRKGFEDPGTRTANLITE